MEIRVTPTGELVRVKARNYTSVFSDFFVREEGTISLSLRGMTIIGTIPLTLSLLLMLYIACKNDMVECTWTGWTPMVSDVICLPFYDRIWCILTTFYALAVR